MSAIARAPATLVERLSPVADRVRRIGERLGAVPWRTAIVLYAWSGGDVYKGDPTPVRVVELTPRPMVRERVWEEFTGVGVVKRGKATLEAVSARYTEGDLDLLFQPTPPAHEVFVEVVADGRDGPAPERRMYRPADKPVRHPTSFEWSMALHIQVDHRDRYGKRRPWSFE